MSLQKGTINEPFELTQNQYEVIKELAEIEGESLGEWIRWCVIKTAEMDIEHCQGGGLVGMGVAKRLSKKWGPESPYWVEESEELR